MAYGFRMFGLAAALLLLAGCVTDSQHNEAMAEIDAFWQEKNANLVATEGRRIVKVGNRDAFVAIQRAAQRLGMIVEDLDRPAGFLLASSTAPTPLTHDEWKIVQDNDTDEMREVIGEDTSPSVELFPHVHRVISLLKRWLLGTHQGAPSAKHLDGYLEEFEFRFNRRTAKHRSLLFERLVGFATKQSAPPYWQIIQRQQPDQPLHMGAA